MTISAGGPPLLIDLSNLCRDRRLLRPGWDADLTLLEQFEAAVARSGSIVVGRLHCVADRSLMAFLPDHHRRLFREMERDGAVDFSPVADERLLAIAFGAGIVPRPMIASLDMFDDFRRSYPEIQGSTDRFVGWGPSPQSEGVDVFWRDMGVHDHFRISRREESAEYKARRLRRDSVVQRAVGTYFRCSDSDCLLAQLWPDHLPELPQFDDTGDRFTCPSCGGVVEAGEARSPGVQMIVFLNEAERFRFVIDEGESVAVGRELSDGCVGLSKALGADSVEAISRRHVSLECRGGEILVTDLESRNGTMLRSVGEVERIPPTTTQRLDRAGSVALPGGVTMERSGRQFPYLGSSDPDRAPAGASIDRATRLIRTSA